MIPVKYSCPRCGDAVTQVPECGPADDVAEWLKQVVAPAIATDHIRQRPTCRPTSFRILDLRLPVTPPIVLGQTKH